MGRIPLPWAWRVSIPIWFDWGVIEILRRQLRSFVSIPIWFDWGKTLFMLILTATSFNSNMVRLGGSNCCLECCHFSCFNSNMVRLGDTTYAGTFASYFVSIPIWFDWGDVFIPHWDLRKKVSIPIWFDWGFAALNYNKPIFNVSIPIWFDWGSFDDHKNSNDFQ